MDNISLLVLQRLVSVLSLCGHIALRGCVTSVQDTGHKLFSPVPPSQRAPCQVSVMHFRMQPVRGQKVLNFPNHILIQS